MSEFAGRRQFRQTGAERGLGWSLPSSSWRNGVRDPRAWPGAWRAGPAEQGPGPSPRFWWEPSCGLWAMDESRAGCEVTGTESRAQFPLCCVALSMSPPLSGRFFIHEDGPQWSPELTPASWIPVPGSAHIADGLLILVFFSTSRREPGCWASRGGSPPAQAACGHAPSDPATHLSPPGSSGSSISPPLSAPRASCPPAPCKGKPETRRVALSTGWGRVRHLVALLCPCPVSWGLIM